MRSQPTPELRFASVANISEIELEMPTKAIRCRIARIMWSSCQTQPFCPMAGPPGGRWARLNPNYLQSVFLHRSLPGMSDLRCLTLWGWDVLLPGHQPLPGDWVETWRLGAHYQLEQLFHLSSCFNQGKHMNCAMQEEDRASLTVSMCVVLPAISACFPS